MGRGSCRRCSIWSLATWRHRRRFDGLFVGPFSFWTQAQLRQRAGDDDPTGSSVGQSHPLRLGWRLLHWKHLQRHQNRWVRVAVCGVHFVGRSASRLLSLDASLHFSFLFLSASYIPPSHFVVLRKFLFSWAGFLFVVVVFCFESAICGPVDDPKLECQRVSLIFDRLDSSSSSSSSSSLIPIPVDLCRVFIQFYWFSFRQVQGRFRRSAISKTRTVAGCFPRYRFTLKWRFRANYRRPGTKKKQELRASGRTEWAQGHPLCSLSQFLVSIGIAWWEAVHAAKEFRFELIGRICLYRIFLPLAFRRQGQLLREDRVAFRAQVHLRRHRWRPRRGERRQTGEWLVNHATGRRPSTTTSSMASLSSLFFRLAGVSVASIALFFFLVCVCVCVCVCWYWKANLKSCDASLCGRHARRPWRRTPSGHTPVLMPTSL